MDFLQVLGFHFPAQALAEREEGASRRRVTPPALRSDAQRKFLLMRIHA